MSDKTSNHGEQVVSPEQLMIDFETLSKEAHNDCVLTTTFLSAFGHMAVLIGGFGPGMGFVQRDIETKLETIKTQCAADGTKEEITDMIKMLDWEQSQYPGE